MGRLEKLYREAGDDLSAPGVRFIGSRADSAADPEEARSLRRLQHLWAIEMVNREALPIDAALAGLVQGGGRDELIEDFPAVTPEKAAAFDFLLARRQALEDSLLRECGYPHYVAFSEAHRQIDVAGLLSGTFTFIRKTRLMYETLLREQAKETLDRDPAALRRSDLPLMRSSTWAAPFFPPRSLEPSLADDLHGLGFDIELPEPGKQGGGVDVFETRYREAGRAVASTAADPAGGSPWSGSPAISETMGSLMGNLAGNTAWLRRHRDRARTPDMSDVDRARLVRRSLFWNLLRVRQAGARILFELIVHRAPPDLYRPYVFTEGLTDEKEIYRQLFGFAFAFNLAPDDLQGYRTEAGPYLEAADVIRGIARAATLEEDLESKFGESWFTSPEAGDHLRTTFLASGSGGEAGGESLPFDVLEERMTRLFTEAENVLDAARR
jgi:hypothetical protein